MLDVMFHFRGSKAVQALPIKDEELILTPDIQSDIGAESDVPRRVSVIASLTPAVECQRLQVRIQPRLTRWLVYHEKLLDLLSPNVPK